MIFGEGSERKKLEQQRRSEGRLPPGQSLTLKWPVLHEGNVPRVDLRTWDFRIEGLVDKPVEGVLFTEVMKLVTPKPASPAGGPEARFAMVRGENGYTANLPLEDLMKPATIFAFKHDGEPLSAEHGYPVRLIVPHLYLWKSVKWVRGFELTAQDEPGFWEQNGYHIYGDPWKEQRFDSD